MVNSASGSQCPIWGRLLAQKQILIQFLGVMGTVGTLNHPPNA